MKILLTTNKTYRGFPDLGYWYVYEPLKQLGHDVLWYDTVKPDTAGFNKVLEAYKPDLIFCCFTGDRNIAPYEPWSEILNETITGRTKTFNWFCDDTWRYNSFSSKVCKNFAVCSTPEPSYVQKYKLDGYDNIILANWHSNSSFYPSIDFDSKDINVCFLGNPTHSRKQFIESSPTPVTNIFGIDTKELFKTYSRSKIGINFSVNDNDPMRKTQMKQRMFEVPAGAGMLMTEYHEGIEEFYEIDKEIITFRSQDEFCKKIKFLADRPKVVKSIAKNGHKRFLKQHDSIMRLEEVINKIKEL
jgi:spore maturation protein CgeB